MDRDRRLSLTVGGLVIASLATLAVAILSLSEQRGIFSPRYRLVAYFDNVSGLIHGAPVWLAGTPIGQVESVALGARPSGEAAVEVVLLVDESVRDRIRSDSLAAIGTVGLLGDRYVEISVGSATGEVLADGRELATVSPLDLNVVIDKGAQALDSINRLTTDLSGAVVAFDEAGGSKSLAASIAAAGDIVSEVRQGQGLLHSMIYDEYEGGGVQSIERSLVTLESILHEIRHGDGVLHSLIYDSPQEQDVVLEALQAGARLNSILAKIDRGEGSLGLMLNDPTLYEELKLLVGGANRSAVVRALINLTAKE
jgi:phospholipid/cholesterol/gamma-HCH transport system substrate-binding protein